MTGAGEQDQARVYRLPGCELDVAARELSRRNKLATVQPEVFELIAYPVLHPESARIREELGDGPAAANFISRARALSGARRAEGDERALLDHRG